MPVHVGAETGYWRFTRAGVVHARGMGSGSGSGLIGGGGGGMVKEMDPDAPGREGRALAPDDNVRISVSFLFVTRMNTPYG